MKGAAREARAKGIGGRPFPGALLLGGAALSGLLFARLLAWSGIPWPACPFHELTGIPCPTCGGLRSLAALGAGDFRAAIGLNPMVALSAAGALIAAASSFLSRRTLRIAPPIRLPLAAILAAAWIANWAYLALAPR